MSQTYVIAKGGIEINSLLMAFGLTLLAGLSTGIGSCIAFVTKHTNRVFLSIILGFSAGVMIYVSFIEIFNKARVCLSEELGERLGSWVTVMSFFGGILLIAAIHRVIPEGENPHTVRPVEKEREEAAGCAPENHQAVGLLRTGVFTASAIALHNFPEGLATLVSALQEPSVAFPIVAAVAIHNIPEGIAVSVPIYQATGSRIKAFRYSFLSGLAEPVGAMFGWILLMPIMNEVVFGIIFAGIAGIMVFISFDELLPAAREYAKHHLSVYGLIFGMFVMAVSLLLFIPA